MAYLAENIGTVVTPTSGTQISSGKKIVTAWAGTWAGTVTIAFKHPNSSVWITCIDEQGTAVTFTANGYSVGVTVPNGSEIRASTSDAGIDALYVDIEDQLDW